MQRSGGQILIDALAINGAHVIFGVPGESCLAALDAIHDSGLRYVTARQEGGAAFMAAAHSDATGTPGICFVTRGPGVSNAMIGLHTAQQGSTPLILLIGQIPSGHRNREAFQEVDCRRSLAPIVKWVAEVNDPARIPEYINRAFRVALSGRPGPVALSLPEDMLFASSDVVDLPAAKPTPAHPCDAGMQCVGAMIGTAKRPLLLLGGTCWSTDGHRSVLDFVDAHDLPVAVAFRRQGLFAHDHANFIGNLGFGGKPMPNDYATNADLIIALEQNQTIPIHIRRR
jgi:acetolactate synthase-1/2/3 large subunit